MGIGDIFSNITKAIRPMGKAPAKQGVPPSVQAGMAKKLPGSGVPTVSAPGAKKPFDVNLYFKAVQLFFSDFFGKKVPMFFQDPGNYLKKAPDWFKRLPQDEQISYGVLAFGHVLFIVGIVLIIVL
ncbi:hypothetical protein KY363_02635 [Candidatus Woesearchaeota archaeon]|nr:hypothetical protein [Candidatus Woesearchaeota archaeon]